MGREMWRRSAALGLAAVLMLGAGGCQGKESAGGRRDDTDGPGGGKAK